MDTHATAALTDNDSRDASVLVHAVARRWLRAQRPATAFRLLAAVTLAVPAAVVWAPLRLPAAVVVIAAVVVTLRAERALRAALLPYVSGLVALYGSAAAARLLVVSIGRGTGSDPVAALLIGLASTLRAIQDADCAPGHLAGCRHRPVSRQMLRSCPGALADVVASATPVVG